MGKQQKVHIVNTDGLGHNTKVTDTETGEAIPYVYDVQVDIGVNDVVRAHISTYMPIVDTIAYADITTHCPYCKQEVTCANDDATPVVGMMGSAWKEAPLAQEQTEAA